ncbi:MAG: SDR family oxidoreductase [Chlamydiales bacterium]
MNRYHWENETELHKNMVSATALKRAAEAEEIAGTVVYLASDQSSYTTGTDILVDGGYLSYCPGR